MKSLRRIVGVLLVFILFVSINEIYALGGGFNTTLFKQFQTSGSVDGKISTVAERIYATISIIIKTIALAGVVITGVKYMMAGATEKSTIKQTLIYLIIGTVFVFAADTIINLVISSGNDII